MFYKVISCKDKTQKLHWKYNKRVVVLLLSLYRHATYEYLLTYPRRQHNLPSARSEAWHKYCLDMRHCVLWRTIMRPNPMQPIA